MGTLNAQGPNTTTTASSTGTVNGTSLVKPKSAGLLPRLMVLVSTEVDTSEDFWSSIQASNSAGGQVKSRWASGNVIKGSEKLNERVFLNCGGDKRSKTEDLAKTLLNTELMRRISTEVSPANSSNSSRASSRAGSRPVSRQSSVDTPSVHSRSHTPSLLLNRQSSVDTPSVHSRSHTPSLLLNRPDSRLSNCSVGVSSEPGQEIDNKSVSSLPEGVRFMQERKKKESQLVRGDLSALALFNPSEPPPKFLPLPTRMTHRKQEPHFSPGQFSTPPPGFSTGIPQLDDVVKQIGDTKEDKLLAPWTAARSWNFTRPRFDSNFKRSSLEVATSGSAIPLYEVTPDAQLLFNLNLKDDDEAVKAKGVHMKRVAPLVDHMAPVAKADMDQLFNTDGLLDLPMSKFANFPTKKKIVEPAPDFEEGTWNSQLGLEVLINLA